MSAMGKRIARQAAEPNATGMPERHERLGPLPRGAGSCVLMTRQGELEPSFDLPGKYFL